MKKPEPPREQVLTSDVEYFVGPAEIHDDVQLCSRYYLRVIDGERMAGKVLSVLFTVGRPVKEVWPYFKDSNLWHNCGDYYYSGVLGDLEGQTFRLSTTPDDSGPHQYKVVKVIPEHLIIWEQPGPWDGGSQPYDGYGMYMLSEHGGSTVISILMQHAIRANNQTDEEALDFWRKSGDAGQRRWRDFFIPELKRLVNDARGQSA